MKNLRRLAFLVPIVFCAFSTVQAKPKAKSTPCSQGTSYRGCPACGAAGSQKLVALNILKNRGKAVTNPEKITVQEIRDPANNTGKFKSTKQVLVTGFVATVDPGGVP